MSDSESLRSFSAAEVTALLDYPALTDRLEQAFREGCAAPLRHHHALPGDGETGGTMLIKPAWRDGGPVAVKIVNVFPGNAARGLPAVNGTVLLFDGETGAPVAVIDGQALTNRRTAAASALAARFLARSGAAEHLVVGTGQLAPELARAHAASGTVAHTMIWGRDPAKASAVAQALRYEGIAAEPTDDLSGAAGRADIISTATLAAEPLLFGAWLKPGVHLDLVGSFRPDMREADDAAVRDCRLFVDTREGALSEAGELAQPIAAGLISEGDIAGELSELCTGAVRGRLTDDEKTLFKSVGTALEDLAAAELVWERAQK